MNPATKPQKSLDGAPAHAIWLPMSWSMKARQIFHERYQERAGIKQFMGNMPQDQAEREAEVEVKAEIARDVQEGLY